MIEADKKRTEAHARALLHDALAGPLLADLATRARLIGLLNDAALFDDLVGESDKSGEDHRIVRIGPSTVLVPIHGFLTKRENFLTREGFWTSTDAVARALASLDGSIETVLFDVDSGGGNHHGPFELSDRIFDLRGRFDTVAVVNETANSAAYLIASACEEIVAVESGQVGSIGVLMQHRDQRQLDEAFGVKVTNIRAGEFKAKPNPHEALDEQALEAATAFVGGVMRLFVDHIARNRGADRDLVASDWATGQIWLAREAVDLGLADRLGTLDAEVDRFATVVSTPAASGGGVNVEINF